ncbi:uncharacterized protein LOC130922235 isoform X2 [Corythoichthys intestinalis]|nr:uncharacterized protein LOC130919419 isoform X2 [Corythoichthys intestinalis]XP_057702854.1 uncharacterized protein LOC130922235 isoform X2 [Corythoichthys intestinalis]
MPSLRSRKSPKQDAIEHALMGLDKTLELEKKYISSFKGRGVFTKAPFRKEDFVVEYRGELIDWDESQKRKMDYGTGRVFVFDFRWQEKTWCIDAAKEDGSLGRLVNDDHKHPNCKMKMIVTEGKPHLCLFAQRDLDIGEEITYDYGPADWPWRKKDKGQSTVTKTAESEISRTREQPPQSKDSDMEVGGSHSTVTEYSEVGVSRTREQQSPKSTHAAMEDVQLNLSESPEFEMSSTTEHSSLGPTKSEVKKLDSNHSFPMDKKNLHNMGLVNYTDSDESQELSINLYQSTIPKLRRTKCMQVNSTLSRYQVGNEIDGNGELLYSTSEDSGDEYIPGTSEESDESEGLQCVDSLVKKDIIKDLFHLTNTSKASSMPSVMHVDGPSPQHIPKRQSTKRKQKSPKKGKGRQPVKKKPWKKEVLAVEKHMMSFITTCRVPRKSDCDDCLKKEQVALKNRHWSAVKFYIKNKITDLKRRV